jgi:hypothetical protein
LNQVDRSPGQRAATAGIAEEPYHSVGELVLVVGHDHRRFGAFGEAAHRCAGADDRAPGTHGLDHLDLDPGSGLDGTDENIGTDQRRQDGRNLSGDVDPGRGTRGRGQIAGQLRSG